MEEHRVPKKTMQKEIHDRRIGKARKIWEDGVR
jgi:hypothetical protein